MKPPPPCHECPDRRVGCHDPTVCRKWADFEAASRAYREDCRASWDERDLVGDYIRVQQARVAKHLQYLHLSCLALQLVQDAHDPADYGANTDYDKKCTHTCVSPYSCAIMSTGYFAFASSDASPSGGAFSYPLAVSIAFLAKSRT